MMTEDHFFKYKNQVELKLMGKTANDILELVHQDPQNNAYHVFVNSPLHHKLTKEEQNFNINISRIQIGNENYTVATESRPKYEKTTSSLSPNMMVKGSYGCGPVMHYQSIEGILSNRKIIRFTKDGETVTPITIAVHGPSDPAGTIYPLKTFYFKMNNNNFDYLDKIINLIDPESAEIGVEEVIDGTSYVKDFSVHIGPIVINLYANS